MAQATAPGKQLFMTALMLWMSGSSLQIFSIMMLVMAFWQPLQKLISVNAGSEFAILIRNIAQIELVIVVCAEFSRFEESAVDLTLPKLVFMGCNLLGISKFACDLLC